MTGSAERFLLKNLFDRASVGAIASAVETAWAGFDRSGFLEAVFDARWPERELKQRVRHISHLLARFLPGSYREQLEVLRAAARHAPAGFQSLVFSDFVEAFGTGDWEASVPALGEFTRLESAEFAIRPFIAADPERTMAQMLVWAREPDPALRRLASEGCRPRLPWGMRLQGLVKDPSPVLPVLEALREDPDPAVRRSVANNLNDISKDHPSLVLEVIEGWSPQPGTPLHALAHHALRTLLKKGDQRALRLLGFDASPEVRLAELALAPPAPSIGGSAQLSFTVVSTATAPRTVTVGYAVHYVKASGARAPKVFRLGSAVLDPGVAASFGRKLSFRQMTTRTHRPGLHRVEVLVSGAVAGGLEFQLGPEVSGA